MVRDFVGSFGQVSSDFVYILNLTLVLVFVVGFFVILMVRARLGPLRW